MKQWVVGATALLIALLPTAQTRGETAEAPVGLPSAEQMATRFTAGLAGSLSLTDEQAPRVESALLDMMRRQREILTRHAAEEPDPAAIRALLRDLESAQTAAREALSGVLTVEQLAGFDRALRDQRAEAAGEGMALRLEKPLGLTREQRDKVAPIFAENARARAEMIDASRSGGRRFGATRGIRDKATTLQQELERKLGQVLTAEQLAKYREIQTERRRSRGRGGPPATP